MRNQQECEHKKSIADYVKSSAASDEIKTHLQTCADCRETEKIMRFMQTGIAAQKSSPKLPTAGFIWWKAQISNKRRHAARASQPLVIAQISAVVIAFVACLWLILTIPSLGRATGQLADSIVQIMPFVIGGFLAFIFISLASVFFLRRFLPGK